MPPIRGRTVSWRVLFQMVTVSGYTAVVKLAGAVKVIFTARAFGMSDGLDAYLIAFLLPSVVCDTLAGSLSSALVPTFIQVRETQGREAATRLYQNVLAAGLGLLALVAMLLAVLAPWFLHVLASSFDAPKLALTRSLFMAMLLTLPLSAFNIVWRSMLNMEGHFALPAVTPAVTPLASIVFLLQFGHTWGVYSLAAGTMAGAALEVALLAIECAGSDFPSRRAIRDAAPHSTRCSHNMRR